MIIKAVELIKAKKYHILGYVLLLVLVLIDAKTKGDLDIFIAASRDLFAGKNIYVELYHEYYLYYYDVSFVLLISPLQFLPPYWASVVWLCLNVILTFRLWNIVTAYLPLHLLSSKQKKLFAWISCIIIFAVWQKNIHLAQMTIFILWLTLEGFYQIEKGKNIAGAALIALGITIKLLPIFLIPYLLYRGRFRSVAYIIGVAILLLYIPGIFIGFEYNHFLLSERWASINPTNSEHVLDVAERSFHSLSTYFSVLLVDGAGNHLSLPYKRNIADVSMDTLKWVINISRLFFIVLTLYFLRSWPFRPANSKLQTLYELSYILLITPLIFPHQQHYAFFLAAPAIMYLTFYYCFRFADQNNPLSKLKKAGILFTAFLVFFLLSSNFVLGEFREVYNHFKTLTYGIFILVIVLAFARPSAIVRGE